MAGTERDIAVLVPTLNEAGQIGTLLNALLAQGFGEIMVADGGSTDATCEIVAAMVGSRVGIGADVGADVGLVRVKAGRGNQINAAARATSAPIIIILHADTRLPPNAAQMIAAALAEPGVSAGCFRLSFDTSSRLLNIYAWASRFETGVTTFGDQAFFMRRSAFEAIGGAPDLPLLEDVAMRDHLIRIGRFVKLPACVVTSARRFAWRGSLRGQLRNMCILAGYRMGIPVTRLAELYGSKRPAGAEARSAGP